MTKLLYVEWCDTVTNNDGWKTKEEAEEWGEKAQWIIKEIGFLIKETKEYILLASRENQWNDTDGEAVIQYGTLTKIPKTWIKKRKFIKI